MSINTNRNVLPDDIQHSHRRGYYLRLLALILGSLTLISLLVSALLFPSYLLISGRIESLQKQNVYLAELISKDGGQALNAELSEAKEKIDLIKKENDFFFHEVISKSLAKRPSGILLSSITLDTREEKTFSVTFTGNASTRENLLAFKSALDELPFVEKVDLPVSLLAKSKDVDFSLEVVGDFKK